jgi:geranylgeranyl diphosphate synthase type II
MEDQVFEEELKRKSATVEQVIRRYLPKDDGGYAKKIREAMCYSMEVGGKRLRPLLMYESYHLFGGESAIVEPFMAAIEMIHTHSLIHDDLPAIDNDDLRRGKPTTHAVYGEPMALLAGDALLNYAYETAFQSFLYIYGRDDFQETGERIVEALRTLSEKTGIRGMLAGQSVDVENEKSGHLSIDRDMLDYIYEYKTSKLIEAPLEIGAILAGADKSDLFCMNDLGKKIGLAFQIQDDILDVTGDEKELGKPLHSDERNEKTTYVTLFGVDGARAKVEVLTEQAVGILETVPGDTAFLIRLVKELAGRTK